MMTKGLSIPSFPEQDENGVDLSIIRENLRLTPWERYEKNFNGTKAMLDMRASVKRVPRDPHRSEAA